MTSSVCVYTDRSDVTVHCSAAGLHISGRTTQEHHRGGHVASDDGRKVQGFSAGDHAGGGNVRFRGGRRCRLVIRLRHVHFLIESNAVVTSEIKLKQNKRKTMFCFSEIVLFQFCFSFISDVTTV